MKRMGGSEVPRSLCSEAKLGAWFGLDVSIETVTPVLPLEHVRLYKDSHSAAHLTRSIPFHKHSTS
jgi:hypothetical protein